LNGNILLFNDNFYPDSQESSSMHESQTKPSALCSRRHWVGAAAALALSACGGIPLRTLPRLGRLSGQLLDTDPAEVIMALQVDARLAPPPGAQAWLQIRLTPRQPGAFDPVDARLPLALAQHAGAVPGLDPAPAGRRWLVYSLPEQTQAELRQVQATVRRAQLHRDRQGGGTLALGIEQNDLAHVPPALAHTPWQTWMQVGRADGFFLLWDGTPDKLLKAAEAARRKASPE